MSEQIGKLVTCTRCDEWIFLEKTGEVGLSNYAGPGSRPTYEDLPKEWMYATGMGHLCPACAERFINLLKEFFGEGTYEKFAPCWKIKEGNTCTIS